MKYIDVSVEKLRHIVQNMGHVIVWCGNNDETHVLVDTVLNNNKYFYRINVKAEIDKIFICGTLRNGEAAEPQTTVSCTPINEDFFAVLRDASAMGINVGGNCKMGSGHMATESNGCMCGYDIELNMKNETGRGFPLENVPILSCALWCSCGYKLFLTSMDMQGHNIVGNLSSTGICHAALDSIAEHRPQWTIGWNNFSFDNSCMKFHSKGEYRNLFHQVKVGAANVVSYGYVMNVEGVYNIDPFCYIQRNPYHNYSDMSLAGVAKSVNAVAKKNMPDLSGAGNPQEIMEYNMADSEAAVDIVVKTGIIKELCYLATCAAAPLYDCVRFMTGAMVGMSYSSEAMCEGKNVDWSKATREITYLGGKVIDPVRGIHEHVTVVDFSSMYPTIMIDARISPETVVVLEPQNTGYGNVTWDSEHVYVDLDTCVARFPRSGDNVIRKLLMKSVTLRPKYKKTLPAYAAALKVVANSAYGCMGYYNSPMFSPVCSSSVTAIGRWLLTFSQNVVQEAGLKVVYGDTDSVMVKRTTTTDLKYNGDVVAHTEDALRKLHDALKQTPFCSMNMQFESYHARMILIDKKKYCKINANGEVTYKGVSVARSDTLGISKHAFSTVSNTILRFGDCKESRVKIANYICGVAEQAILKNFKPWDVSMVRKQNQRKCYVYTDAANNVQAVPIDMSANNVSSYSTAVVLSAFRKEVSKLLAVCGMGTVDDIVTRHATLF